MLGKRAGSSPRILRVLNFRQEKDLIFSSKSMSEPLLADVTETGRHGLMYLRHFWSRQLLARSGKIDTRPYITSFDLDQTLLSLLRLSIEPVNSYLLREAPDFEVFEDWIDEVTGNIPDPLQVARFNEIVASGNYTVPEYDVPESDILSKEQWKQWNESGYLIVPGAISPEACTATLELMHRELEIDPDNPETWYGKHTLRQGIMIQLFHHPLLEQNRLSPRIRNVFAQLWQNNEVLPSADRVSFNPPETDTYVFQGPDLHWDVSLQTPIPFGTQGLIYLTDTAANQGAFTLVPGFHHRVENWLRTFPEGRQPRAADLHALGSVPIAGKAGDLIVWHQALPHGSSPNRSGVPRYVQYINYQPYRMEIQPEWI